MGCKPLVWPLMREPSIITLTRCHAQSSHPIPQLSRLQATVRIYALVRAHKMPVASDAIITRCPAAAQAKTPEEAKRTRVEAAPMYLKGRVRL